MLSKNDIEMAMNEIAESSDYPECWLKDIPVIPTNIVVNILQLLIERLEENANS